ncbi:InlB B-repeat-containing protein [Peptoniphilus sp. MSJ-1]|uniref:InlB B-repeat-containing protein n=1 Tax=Peptoniphilus ovalis TaxID=2841503 RepID=A0ABS6FIB8_9FIRM|nr:InlB B-repeat-containing protein [Peptoniphilus ovalis]MBU5669922.1 InlB B-repeat-containing protein [Peptoniphilus ovalis]
MKNRILSFLMAITMILEILAPQIVVANKRQLSYSEEDKTNIIDAGDYPKITGDIFREIARNESKKQGNIVGERGSRPFSSPYIPPGNTPTDENKPLFYLNLKSKFELVGLEGREFDWDKIFKSEKIGLKFFQLNDEGKRTGVQFHFKAGKNDEPMWEAEANEPAKLPVYSNKLKPYTYEVEFDGEVAKNVQLVIGTESGTPSQTTWIKDPATGEYTSTATLPMAIYQVAATSFSTVWNTALNENERPEIIGEFEPEGKDTDDPEALPVNLTFPKNDNDEVVLRARFKENYEEDDSKNQYPLLDKEIKKTPRVAITGGDEYTIDDARKTITFRAKKFKYEFNYDVVDGGKLTMTEIIPITFDANGGKFASITDSSAEQKITKEVEYGKDLTEKIETPSNEGESFQAWGIKDDTLNINPINEGALKNITKAKTFYAIWNNDIIPQDGDNKPENVPDNYVKVTFDMTDKVKSKKDFPNKIYWVNPDKEVSFIEKEPRGTWIDLTTLDKEWMFKEWENNNQNDNITISLGRDKNGEVKVPDDTLNYSVIKGKFTQNTIFKAKYNLIMEETLIPIILRQPYVVPVYTFVSPDNLVVNVNGSKDKRYTNFPESTIYYFLDGETKVSHKTSNTPKTLDVVISVSYRPNDKLTNRSQIKKGQIIFVENVVPQTGEEKPLVPDNYVKVTLIPGELSNDENTIYWVNPKAEVTIKEADVNPIKGHKLTHWTLDKKEFDFTKKYKFTEDKEIYAQYSKKGDSEEIDQPGVKFIVVNIGDKIPYDTYKDNIIPRKGLNVDYIKVIQEPDTSKATFPYDETDTKGQVAKVKIKYDNNFEEEVEIPITVVPDYIDITDDQNKEVPKDFVKVTVELTDKADLKDDNGDPLTGEDLNKAKTKIYKVNPNKEVSLPTQKPTGKTISKSTENPVEFTWNFEKWTSDETPSREWKEKIIGQFKNETTITANYTSGKADNGELLAEEKEVFESYKLGNEWINNFIPTEDDLKDLVKLKDDNGNKDLPTSAIVELVVGEKASGEKYTNLKEELYDKLQEKDETEVYRIEHIKAKVTFKNGEAKEIQIPIKVIKNIYEAKTLTQKPIYVPNNYEKVTLNPTTKAKDPQKTYYYVNPDAFVKIPGTDPTGNADNTFTQWQVDRGVTKFKDTTVQANKKYELASRYKFARDTIIQAQYVKDVIPEDASGKPSTVPDNYVKVTFVPTEKANDATNSNKIFWVNPAKEVKIPVENPVGKQHFTFKEWKLGVNADGDAYNPSEARQFTQKETTITATYDVAKDIIPYDPKEPTTRPDGYVRVSFEAEDGLDLSDVKFYYVKKNSSIKLGDASLAKPSVTADTGYKFTSWDKADTLEITDVDVVVKAQSNKLPTLVPEEDDQGKQNDKPNGYVEVSFVIKAADQSKGSIKGVSKFYVNPKEYVKINPPATEASTGYEFGAWDVDATIPRVYTEDITTITGSFNQIKNVIPKTKDDDSEKPKGYKTVTFEIEGVGGSINAGETSVYYVDPNRDVTLTPPKTTANIGYEFNTWTPNPATLTKYENDTTIKGSFKKLDDIIPKVGEGDKENPKPEGYVSVTFLPGDNGKLEGKTVYYVNPTANPAITLGNVKIIKPTIKPNVGYKVADQAWDKVDNTEIKSDTNVTAQYTPLDDVIPKTKNDDSEKPSGYITVKFSGEENGTLTGNTVFYINPNKAVVLQNNAPTINPNTGYEAAGWDTSLNRAIKYNDGDVIKAQYNPLNNIYEEEKPGYVKVEFNKGQHGELKGTVNYWIKPGVEVTIPEPTVKPNIGYNFKQWDKTTTITAKANDPTYVITATYDSIADVIPGDQAKPNGYVEVKFVADNNGNLSGTTLYYVNPNKNVDLTTQANAIVKNPNVGFTEVGGTWNPNIDTNKKYTDRVTTYTFNFKKLDDVIPGGDNVTQPKGYVKVDFIAGANGSLAGGNKTYYVNPSRNVMIVDQATGATNEIVVPTPTPSANYEFDSWSPAIDKTNSITSSVIYEARFKSLKVIMTYDGNGNTEGTVPEALSYDVGTEITLAGGRDLKKNNYVLKAWKIRDKTYAPGEKFTIKENTTATAVWEEDFHNVSFNTDGGTYIEPQKVKHGGTITPVTSPTKEGYTFTGWKVDGNDFNPTNDKVTKDITLVAQYVPNVIPQTGEDKPNNVPTEYISITVKTTDKATENKTEIFWVAPNKDVTISVQNPTGKKVERTTTEAEFTWIFDGWKSDETTPREWKDIISGVFTKATTITAQYTKDNAKAGDIVVEKYATTESIKDNNGNFINNYLPTEEELKSLIKVVDANEEAQPLAAGDSVLFTIEAGKTFDEVIYEKLKEKPDYNKDVRVETIEAEITFANGVKKNVAVPIYVYKNIYEGLTLYGKPLEVVNAEAATAKEYIRVALIPTEKAINQQIRVFYVRKNAAVIIPGQDPTGRDNYIFKEWRSDKDNLINANAMFRAANIPLDPPVVKDNEKVDLGNRMRFDQNTDIKAQYDKKPDPKPEVPDKPTPDTPDKPSLPDYRPDRPSYGGGGSTIFVEKPVEKIIKVPDNAYGKEVWYMQGFENEFRPKDGLTRAEAAQILANALLEDGYKFNKDYKISYKDVGDAWYTKAVKIVTEANVFEGYDDGEFKPQKKITRAEWISTLKRFQKLSDKSGNHMNLRDGHWAMAEVEAAYEAGWLKIYKGGLASFKEDEIISREEVAAVSNKAFDRVLDKTYIKRNEKSLVTYKDVDENMWSYEDILCASNTFLFKNKDYRAHWVDRDKNIFNIDTSGFEIVQDKFQRDPR